MQPQRVPTPTFRKIQNIDQYSLFTFLLGFRKRPLPAGGHYAMLHSGGEKEVKTALYAVIAICLIGLVASVLNDTAQRTGPIWAGAIVATGVLEQWLVRKGK